MVELITDLIKNVQVQHFVKKLLDFIKKMLQHFPLVDEAQCLKRDVVMLV